MQTRGAEVSVKYVKSRRMHEVSVTKISNPEINGRFYFESKHVAAGSKNLCVREVLGLGLLRSNLPSEGESVVRTKVRRYRRWSEI